MCAHSQKSKHTKEQHRQHMALFTYKKLTVGNPIRKAEIASSHYSAISRVCQLKTAAFPFQTDWCWLVRFILFPWFLIKWWWWKVDRKREGRAELVGISAALPAACSARGKLQKSFATCRDWGQRNSLSGVFCFCSVTEELGSVVKGKILQEFLSQTYAWKKSMNWNSPMQHWC